MSEQPTPERRRHNVSRYMSVDLQTITPQTTVMAAARLLLQHHISGAPVMNEAGELIGVVSERDVMKVLSGDTANAALLVQAVMSTQVVTVPQDMSMITLASLFKHNPYRRLPVVHEGKLVGQISRSDLLRALAGNWQ